MIIADDLLEDQFGGCGSAELVVQIMAVISQIVVGQLVFLEQDRAIKERRLRMSRHLFTEHIVLALQGESVRNGAK